MNAATEEPDAPLLQVRCPNCNKLAGEVSERARVRIKCSRCGEVFAGHVVAQRSPR